MGASARPGSGHRDALPLNGYLEGWAEYAAGFCDEIGLYADPLDRYGRLCSERFHAARLVVDTGLNVLGWTRERAAAYLRASGFLSDTEVSSEVLRYAVDDPGQALAYHLGYWHRLLACTSSSSRFGRGAAQGGAHPGRTQLAAAPPTRLVSMITGDC